MEFQTFSYDPVGVAAALHHAGGFLAGFVDSIAGGGGLISLPVLLAAGLPPHLAIGTNKFSATFGAVMSAWQFWRAGKVDMSLLKRILPGTFIGAILGCLVMLHLKSEWLQPIIIIALIAAAVFVFSQRQLGAASTYSGNTRKNVVAALVMASAIGFYDASSGRGRGLPHRRLCGFGLRLRHGCRQCQDPQPHEQCDVLRPPHLVGPDSSTSTASPWPCASLPAPSSVPAWLSAGYGLRPPGHAGRHSRPHR